MNWSLFIFHFAPSVPRLVTRGFCAIHVLMLGTVKSVPFAVNSRAMRMRPSVYCRFSVGGVCCDVMPNSVRNSFTFLSPTTRATCCAKSEYHCACGMPTSCAYRRSSRCVAMPFCQAGAGAPSGVVIRGIDGRSVIAAESRCATPVGSVSAAPRSVSLIVCGVEPVGYS